ncbi:MULTISPECIES: ROK family protein [unclassified Pseudoalteromonas]|uniref:ROK family protein n=1 Tax=unclassified Pseudoalteromonas TaxID=194690 RepID=UPI002096C5A6|nr:ROK family protein [Pseudoalteromonas sp. XMcav2-N]MCO7190584.1 ROK family protein [Pseudoalteromonas sp. XMcav2-N]
MSMIVSVDLGGTKAQVARVDEQGVYDARRYSVPATATKSQVNDFITGIVAEQLNTQCCGIAIGVPGMVDLSSGTVLETVNIPAWQDVPLAAQLNAYFSLPVVVNNDVNCFTMGEYCYGHHYLSGTGLHTPVPNLLGVCLGTGLGAGLVFDGRLYSGRHCAAGEFGSFPYRDGILEHYTSGQFFLKRGTNGAEQALLAQQGDRYAQSLFDEFGSHLGYALAQTLLAFDPDKIVLGGSVSQSYDLFERAMWQSLARQTHPALFKRLEIAVGTLEHAALRGAYKLFQQQLSEGI